MNERIKRLRNAKKMTQVKFGKIIGLSQKAVSALEEDGGTVTERNFNTICEKFSVNPDWLRFGIGEMFLADSVGTYIDKVAAEKQLSEEDKALIKSVIELPPEARKAFITWARKLMEGITAKPSAQEKAQENERRKLEKIIADAQNRLAKLDASKSERFGDGS